MKTEDFPVTDRRTVSFENGELVLIDQTKLPEAFELIRTRDIDRIAQAIVSMEVRGAPAIGATAGYAMALAAEQSSASSPEDFLADLNEAKEKLEATRPTATNLFWALDRMMSFAEEHVSADLGRLSELMLEEAHRIADEDIEINTKISRFGNEVIFDGASIHTHCNCGATACVGVGTAVGAMVYAHTQGKRIHVYTDETRPRLQGAKINVWELEEAGVPYTLIPDNHAAYLMKQGKIDMVFIGADRVVANGDTAAKIGVYGAALAANHHDVPVYVFTPKSTIDMSIPSGDAIEIEERDPDEVRKVNGSLITLAEANVLNYAFDVTPHEMITALITEEGIIYPPFDEGLQEIFSTTTTGG